MTPSTRLVVLLLLINGAFTFQLVTESKYPSVNPGEQKVVITIKDGMEPSRRASTETRTRVMRDKEGHTYTCRLPSRTMPSQHTSSELAGAAPMPAEVAPDMEAKSPSELLDQLNSLCLYRIEGLWTYEMCYKKQTRQFRKEVSRMVTAVKAETISAEDFSCGKYDDNQDLSIKYDASVTGMPMEYISHNMTGGAACVLTGSLRTSEVRFTCMPHAKDNVLVLVKEFPSCNYIFVVATPFLCNHPEFRPAPERTHTIRCYLGGGERTALEGAAGVPPPPAPNIPSPQPADAQAEQQCHAQGACPADSSEQQEDEAMQQEVYEPEQQAYEDQEHDLTVGPGVAGAGHADSGTNVEDSTLKQHDHGEGVVDDQPPAVGG